MSHAMTFEDAAVFWRTLLGQDAEPVWDRFAEAERVILDHLPRSAAEALTMFDVLLEQVDMRSDGYDLRALHNLRRFLASQLAERPVQPAQA